MKLPVISGKEAIIVFDSVKSSMKSTLRQGYLI